MASCAEYNAFSPDSYTNLDSADCGGVNTDQACAAQVSREVEEDPAWLQGGTENPQEGCAAQTAERKQIPLTTWLRIQAVLRSGAESLCEKHQERLSVFCMEDHILLCLVCDKSKAHRTHTVLPMEEAAQDYKKEIQVRLENLKLKRNSVQDLKLMREKRIAEHLEDIKVEREKIVLQFQQLRLFLQEQENFLLTQLGDLEKEMEKIQEENCTKHCDTLLLLDDLISDVEENCQRPAREFLQNLKKTLSWCEKGNVSWPIVNISNLEKKLSAMSQKSVILMENLDAFKETLAVELKRVRAPWLNALVGGQAVQPQVFRSAMCSSGRRGGTKANVTLDPRTANVQLIVSPDQKTVKHRDFPSETWRHGVRQLLPDNSERFDTELFVLGCEGFCSGKHSWVVKVEQGQSWAVGIARESVKRKGYVSLSPEQGIWAVEQCWGQFQALTSHWTSLSLPRKPRRIQVTLDYERGWVEFFDADLDAPVFSFPPTSFTREKIYPWFWVGPGSHLSMCL